MDIAIIILAAGASVRMGQSKQLLPINGMSLLQRSVTSAIRSELQNVFVVLGANREEHSHQLSQYPVEIVENEEWEKGIGTSIRSGLRHSLIRNPLFNGALIMVCDQPFVNHLHINKLVSEYRSSGRSVASAYAGTHGVPVLFDKDIFPELLQLEDAHGAKKILRDIRYGTVEFEAGAIDLDTRLDYENFINKIVKQ